MGRGAAIGLAAASSFGAGFGLLRLPDMQRGLPSNETSPARYLTWNALWGVAAAVTIVLFLFFIGPGLQ
jgi:hypothetical protein